MKTQQLVGTLMVMLSAAGFGLMGIFAKIAYSQGVTVSTLLIWRFLIAAAMFWLWIAVARPNVRLRRKDRWTLLAMGTGGYALMATLLFSSFYYMSASLAEMLFYSYPLLVCIMMRLLHKEPVTIKKAIVLSLCFIGLLLILHAPADRIGMLGSGCALTASLIYALFIAGSHGLAQRVSPVVSSAHITSWAGAALLAAGLIRGNLQEIGGLPSWWAIIGVAICSTFIAILMFFEGVKRIGSSRASLFSVFEPIVTLAAGAAVFGERLGGLQWTGVGVVLFSLLLLELKLPALPRFHQKKV